MHCLAAVVDGPEANMLTPVSYSEATVVVLNERLKVVGVPASQLHVSFKSPVRFEIPDFQRVSFRTKLHAYTRTSSTLLLSTSSFARRSSHDNDAHPTC